MSRVLLAVCLLTGCALAAAPAAEPQTPEGYVLMKKEDFDELIEKTAESFYKAGITKANRACISLTTEGISSPPRL